METQPVIRCRRARNKRKKEKKQLRKAALCKSPSRNLGILNRVIERRSRECMKNIKTWLFSSMSENPCGSDILGSNQSQPLEETIDLIDCDNSLNSSVVVMPSSQIEQKIVIDLSQDVPVSDVNEVIDLTKPNSGEPAVIDISEDDLNNQQNALPDDEVSVIGTFSRHSGIVKKSQFPHLIPFSNNFNNLIKCSEKLKKKYLNKQFVFDKIDNKSVKRLKKNFSKPKKDEKVAKVGMNIYVSSPMTLPSNGLRPIIIDGSNVAYVHSNCNFSCKRLQICINYFKEKGHKVTAFVPQFRLNNNKSDNPELLRKLEMQGDVVLTPSKTVDGRRIVPYDDRFIVQTAVLKGGIIVTRDNYNDLLKENPAWAETIKYRTLAFTWVDDVLMFPSDPLGEYGPSLEEFLRFQ